MVLDLRKEDILKMGDTIFSLDGFTTIKMNSNDSAFGLTEIFTRNILKLFGEEYNISQVEDYELDNEGYNVIIIKTNLPWTEIEKINDISRC